VGLTGIVVLRDDAINQFITRNSMWVLGENTRKDETRQADCTFRHGNYRDPPQAQNERYAIPHGRKNHHPSSIVEGSNKPKDRTRHQNTQNNGHIDPGDIIGVVTDYSNNCERQ
jgi:hypothetical protein